MDKRELLSQWNLQSVEFLCHFWITGFSLAILLTIKVSPALGSTSIQSYSSYAILFYGQRDSQFQGVSVAGAIWVVLLLISVFGEKKEKNAILCIYHVLMCCHMHKDRSAI